MFRIITFLLLILTPLQATGQPTGSDGSDWDQPQNQLVDFALERFAKAGLQLPSELEIDFPTEEAKCFGYGGVYMPDQIEVRICRPSDTTIVHELAHAWIETTLTESERQAFLELRGLDTWTGGTEWDKRGAEQAGEILTWGLMDRDITVRWLVPGPNDTSVETFRLFKIANSSYAELAAAYRLLTGTDPVERTAPSGMVEAGENLSSPEARRSGRALKSEVGGLRHKGVIVSPEAVRRASARQAEAVR